MGGEAGRGRGCPWNKGGARSLAPEGGGYGGGDREAFPSHGGGGEQGCCVLQLQPGSHPAAGSVQASLPAGLSPPLSPARSPLPAPPSCWPRSDFLRRPFLQRCPLAREGRQGRGTTKPGPSPPSGCSQTEALGVSPNVTTIQNYCLACPGPPPCPGQHPGPRAHSPLRSLLGRGS